MEVNFMNQNSTFVVSEEEREKELFEYEMTQVLLQLKDEFKKFSSSDMDCAGIVDVPQVSLNISKVEGKPVDTIEPLNIKNSSLTILLMTMLSVFAGQLVSIGQMLCSQ